MRRLGQVAFGQASKLGPEVLHQADMLTSLHEVAFDGFVCVRAVFTGRGEHEARPGHVVSSLDGLKPCSFNRVSGGGMEVFDERTCAREIVGPFVGFIVVCRWRDRIGRQTGVW